MDVPPSDTVPVLFSDIGGVRTLRSLTTAAVVSLALIAGCSSHSSAGHAQPSIASLVLPYDVPPVFFVPIVVPSGLEVWINADKPGTFLLLSPGLSAPGSVRLSYQVDRPVLAGQNLGSEKFGDALVKRFDSGSSVVWWRSGSTYVVVTFSDDFTLDVIRQFVDGLESADRAGWDNFARLRKKLDPGSY